MTDSRQQQSAALDDIEAQYHLMIQEVEDYAILMLDCEGTIRNWNRGAEKIKGYSQDEIVGSNFRVFYTPEDRATGLPERLIGQAVEKGKAVHEGWRVRKDGTRFWGSILITALHDRGGNVVGFCKVTRDLTERKAAEDQILQTSRRLELQNQELQRFAYAAAHDMKEPLRKISLYTTVVLGEDTGKLLNARQLSALNKAASSAEQMKNLIDDLLTFAKTMEKTEHFEVVDLGGILSGVVAFQQEALDEAGGSVVYSGLPAVRGVGFQLRQLFANLLSNSIKYRGEGRPLRISVTAEKVRGPGSGKGYFNKISFVDNGIGFDPVDKEKIFDLFERLHGRDKYSGTGLGLAICKRIMESHGGFIRASGMPDEGAVFDLHFPSVDQSGN
jgi:PAS domain S-box-containing protein